MSLTSKIVCFIVLATSFLLILATGRSNVRNFERVQEAIAEIYKDRLVVNGLIFELSSLLNEKEIAIISNDVVFFADSNPSINKQVEALLQDFRATKLTNEEAATLASFSQNIDQLKTSENKSDLANTKVISGSTSRTLRAHLKRLDANLKTLSEIQLAQGEQKLKISEHAVKRMNEFANLELYSLVLITILIVGLFFVPRSIAKTAT